MPLTYHPPNLFVDILIHFLLASIAQRGHATYSANQKYAFRLTVEICLRLVGIDNTDLLNVDMYVAGETTVTRQSGYAYRQTERSDIRDINKGLVVLWIWLTALCHQFRRTFTHSDDPILAIDLKLWSFRMKHPEMIRIPTGHDYRNLLDDMYRQGYRELQPEKLRRSLHDYFMFLERAITGIEEISFTDAEFSLPELEAVIQYQESIFKKLIEKKLTSANRSSIAQEKYS